MVVERYNRPCCLYIKLYLHIILEMKRLFIPCNKRLQDLDNHAFVDGNKRIGTHVLLVFLELNKIELEYTQQELSDIILKVAADEYSFENLLKWILEHQLLIKTARSMAVLI